MSDFKAKNAPNSILAGVLPQTPLGELTALPQIPELVGRGLAAPSQEPYPASALRASILCAFGASVLAPLVGLPPIPDHPGCPRFVP